jgi:hypothetical protein
LNVSKTPFIFHLYLILEHWHLSVLRVLNKMAVFLVVKHLDVHDQEFRAL